ncbi:phosphoribosyl-dephospho-CoA transferase [Sulfuricella sp. T08]|uniref:malonate decarboxylase holo-[acyl-carrier-protein] synthase n=1 Tax=Sulfuricella sp. T08 TaxID=1632857 RepID=UPI00061796F2|nr:malonate decarboxylase holo-[acyl-carrier-protein] synthase [Sulfuricella sp. T08]GAO34759.1 phosphoribosyl-dephospho-CoA transferase [Sulfuricella sp. T08]
MSTAPFHRHDLVWLDPGIDAGRFVAAAEHVDCARNWVKQGRPLVVARQPEPVAGQTDPLILGFTLYSAPARKRITLRASRAAIIRHSRPLLLLDTIDHAPRSWRTGIYSLHALCAKAGAVPRVYGSLSSQAFTGAKFLDEASDLDLLLECNETTQLHALLAALEAFPVQTPRIDGEILAPTGWAVAWRELAGAIRAETPRQVLAKSDCETRLISVDQLFTHPLST